MSKTNTQFELMKKEIEKLDAKRFPNQKVRTINTIVTFFINLEMENVYVTNLN